MRAKLIITIAVILVGMVVSVLGQSARSVLEPEKTAYKPTELQAAKLENLQLKAQLAQKALMDAQSKFQQSLADLTNEAAAVKKANGWPENVAFDPNSVSFSAPKEEVKK